MIKTCPLSSVSSCGISLPSVAICQIWQLLFEKELSGQLSLKSSLGGDLKKVRNKSCLMSNTNEGGTTSCKNNRNRKSRGHTRNWWTNPIEGSTGWADDGIEVLANDIRIRGSRVYTGWVSQEMSYQTRRCRHSILYLYHVYMTCFLP